MTMYYVITEGIAAHMRLNIITQSHDMKRMVASELKDYKNNPHLVKDHSTPNRRHNFSLCHPFQHNLASAYIRFPDISSYPYIILEWGFVRKGNNKITELHTILQRESQNS